LYTTFISRRSRSWDKQAVEKQADGKILAGVEISAPGEIAAAIEKPAEQEKQAACLLFRLGGIYNC
jgi:hypothetical protein